MANALTVALAALDSAVDAVGPKLGLSAENIAGFDNAIGVVSGEGSGVSNQELLIDIALSTAVIAFLPEELITAGGAAVLTSVVGEEGVLAAVASVNEALAITMPGAFSLSAGEAVVGTASSLLGNLTLNLAVIPAFSQWVTAATNLLMSPSSVSFSTLQAGQTTIANETAVLISDGGDFSLGGSSLVTTFNFGSTSSNINLTAGGLGSQNLVLNGTGQTPLTVQLNGVAVITSPSQPNFVGYNAAGAMYVSVPFQASGKTVTVIQTNNGAYEIDYNDPEQIAAFSDFTGGTIDISQASNGTIDVTTDIGGGDSNTVESGSSVSGIVQDFMFNDTEDTLEIDNPLTFPGTISNFLPGDAIDLAGLGAASGATLGANNVLTIQELDGSTVALQLDPSQSFAGYTFVTQYLSGFGLEVTDFAPPTTSGSQTITITTPTDLAEGVNTSYSVGVSFSPTNIQFPAYRTADQEPPPVSVTATYLGGTPDPNLNDSNGVVINQSGPDSLFILESGVEIGSLNTSGTFDVEIQPGVVAPGNYSDETFPLSVLYDAGSYSETSATVDLTLGFKVYATAVAEYHPHCY